MRGAGACSDNKYCGGISGVATTRILGRLVDIAVPDAAGGRGDPAFGLLLGAPT
ncbi:hypothetical protein MAIC_04440 [Mycolicibacterium aichiense]|uniref:Uncharacterized protein n=1 Tax=Mycolicibacterium aichiense TaxID=1799 RepID=A0AAD1MAI0_9MYCO|nr:hypothetical protein MAIC_04440 [Mycolicibacterium aichiense]